MKMQSTVESLELQHEEGTQQVANAKPNSIAVKHPELLNEWDWDKNKELGLSPYKMTCGMQKKANWICSKCGYRWPAAVSSRAKGHGCPKCGAESISKHRSKPKAGNSLADKHPELLSEWDYDKNNKTPNDYAYMSNKSVSWICSSCGHKWDAVISSRSKGHGCPKCASSRNGARRAMPSKGESLAETYPEIAAEWDYEKNGDLTPDMVTHHSKKIVWWRCATCGYIWRTTVGHRTNGTGCPKCKLGRSTSFPEMALLFYVRKIYPSALGNYTPPIKGIGKRSFDIWIPELSYAIEYDGEYWHKDRLDRDIDKDALCRSNGISVVRVREPECSQYDEGLATIIVRESATTITSLNKAIKEVLAILSPLNTVYVNVNKDMAFINQLFGSDNDTDSLINNPVLLNEWHPTLNVISPEECTVKDQTLVWWICPNGHKPYQRTIANRARKGSGCPECNREAARIRALQPKDGQSLLDLFPAIASEWEYVIDNTPRPLTPDKVKPQSNYVVKWKCSYCGKTWDAQINSRTHRGKDALGCRSCRTYIRYHGIDWLISHLSSQST